MPDSVNARRRPLIPHRKTPPPRTLLDLPGQLALLSPQALIQLFDGLAAGARAGALAMCMRVHGSQTPGNLEPLACSSVFR